MGGTTNLLPLHPLTLGSISSDCDWFVRDMDGELEEKEVLFDSTRGTANLAALVNGYKKVQDLTLPRELRICKQVMMMMAAAVY